LGFEWRATGRAWFSEVLLVAWLVALVVSMVVATRDDTREGTGFWYGKKGFLQDENLDRIRFRGRWNKWIRSSRGPGSRHDGADEP
jgi:hypothetical protein